MKQRLKKPENIEIGRRLSAARRSMVPKKAQSAIADAVGVSIPQVSRWENGEDGIPSNKIEQVAAAYGLDPYAVFSEVGVPIVGYVGAGGETVYLDDNPRGSGMNVAPRLPDLRGEMIGLEIRGDSMLPFFRNGYIAYISRQHDGVEEGAFREISVCRLTDGRTLLKQVRKSLAPGKFDLLSFNAEPIEGVGLEWATPIRAWLTTSGR